MANPPPPPGAPIAWMQKPNPIPGVPVGLEYLSQIDCLNITQEKSLTEILTGWERNNKYRICNATGQQCYFAIEETDTCMRQCCGKDRGFTIKVLDNLGEEVIRITRDFKCCAGCCWVAGCLDCCAYLIKVEAPVGHVVGYIKQGGSFLKANYKILNEYSEEVLNIQGPYCVWDGACCPCENEFKLMTKDGTSQIGSVKKVYADLLTELVSNSDKFTIDFPMDLSTKVKACLMGALFMIDFMYFEQSEDN